MSNRAQNPPPDVLPVHSIEAKERVLHVLPIDYTNPYDFKQEHRHDYFEVLFFETGGATQLIDFVQYPVLANSCHIVHPQQVHLLRRNNATGRLVQFREELIPALSVITALRRMLFHSRSAVIFENDRDRFEAFQPLLDLLERTALSNGRHSREASLHLLQALLLQLVDSRTTPATTAASDAHELLFRFQQLLDAHYVKHHAVQHYVRELATTDKKLAAATKALVGLSPLQVIHDRLLLEAKRLLLFGDTSHKDIAFRLGFDSPASFSQFVRNKTGRTPSELVSSLVEIHK